jgi:hypothetical protein
MKWIMIALVSKIYEWVFQSFMKSWMDYFCHRLYLTKNNIFLNSKINIIKTI